MSVSDWSTTASSNTSIDGVNIDEGCAAGNVNNALRSIMAAVRTFYNTFSAFTLTLVGSTDAAAFRTAIGAAASTTAAPPSGMVADFAMNAAPAGWLECDGSAVSRTTYALLFAAIGSAWGNGDGSTTFNLPDFRGEFRRGWDHGRGADAGRTFASAQAAQLAAHKHLSGWGSGIGSNAHGSSGTIRGSSSFVDPGQPEYLTDDASGAGNAAGLIGTETRPRNVAVLTCIKV